MEGGDTKLAEISAKLLFEQFIITTDSFVVKAGDLSSFMDANLKRNSHLTPVRRRTVWLALLMLLNTLGKRG